MTANPTIAACRATLAEHSKSFALACKFLPPQTRDQVALVSAWCQRAHSAVDQASKAEEHAALDKLVNELDEIYQAAPAADPVLAALQITLRRCQIPREYPQEFLAGVHMDIVGQRYLSLESLLHYCYRIAGTVGLMTCHIMGVHERAALRSAAHLGMAMQLAGICHNTTRDWQRGRVYIPDSILDAHGLGDLRKHRDSLPQSARAPLERAQSELRHHANGFARSGESALQSFNLRCALAIRTAQLLLHSALANPTQAPSKGALAGPGGLPLRETLTLVGRAAAQSARELPLRARRRVRRLLQKEPVATPAGAPLQFPVDVWPL